MARQEKKTRIRGLPPRLFLQQKDARTGSFPTAARIASDNRSGQFNVKFDDTTTVVFLTQSVSVSLGAGVPEAQLTSPNYQEFGQDMSSSLSGAGSIAKGVSDHFLAFTPGQKYEPFREHFNPAVNAKSSNYAFYATGSRPEDVGEGFSSPLWSKTKIEIDLGVKEEHKIQLQSNNGDGANQPMAYWNPGAQTFQGIGPGYEWTRYDTSGPPPGTIGAATIVRQLFEEQPIGFASSFDPVSGTGDGPLYGGGSRLYSNGTPISNYQFPYHSKFHATSSNLIDMADYITEPFYAEKIVLEWTGSLTFDDIVTDSHDTPTCTFFIMNQRGPVNFESSQRVWFRSGSGGGDARTTITTSVPATNLHGVEVNTLRDLVTWANVTYWQDEPGMNAVPDLFAIPSQSLVVGARKDLNISPNSGSVDATGGSALGDPAAGEFWAGRFIMSGAVRSPVALADDTFPGGSVPAMGEAYKEVTWFQRSGSTAEDRMIYFERLKHGGRNGLGTPTGRDMLSPLGTAIDVFPSLSLGYPVGFEFNTNTPKEPGKANPYLLLPTDKLILGWQTAIPTRLNATASNGVHAINNEGMSLTWYPGEAKLTIYGSTVKEGKEHHDTLNQLLTSNTIHEGIQ